MQAIPLKILTSILVFSLFYPTLGMNAEDSSYAYITPLFVNETETSYILHINPHGKTVNALEVTMSSETPLTESELVDTNIFILPKESSSKETTLRYVFLDETNTNGEKVVLHFANNSQKNNVVTIKKATLYLADGHGTPLE